MGNEIIALGLEQVMPTAQLLAAAFESDPAYRYLFPNPRERPKGLADFFARNLRTHLPHHCTHARLDPQGLPLATVTLRPPQGIHISLWTMLRRGLLPFLFAHGRLAVERLLWLKDTYDALEASAAQSKPHFYVHMMAVQPQAQGRGHGGELLADILASATAGAPDVPAVLTTHNQRCVAFYRRAGFQVTDEQRLHPPGSESYTVWSMKLGESARA